MILSRREKIRLLKLEQEREQAKYRVHPQIIIPPKKLPYEEIKDERMRAIRILHQCGFCTPILTTLFNSSRMEIRYILSKSFEILPPKK